MGLILPGWGIILSRIPPPSRCTPLLGICTYTNTPKPTPKYPFSWPELESGQNEQLSGQFGPQLGKMFEKKAKLSRTDIFFLIWVVTVVNHDIWAAILRNGLALGRKYDKQSRNKIIYTRLRNYFTRTKHFQVIWDRFLLFALSGL